MVDIVNFLKANARILHRQAKAGQAVAIKRIYQHHLTGSTPDLENYLKRQHCLTVVAREMGFRNWGHASNVFEGRTDDDFGTVLSPARCNAHWNIWFASYGEAKSAHQKEGGYLLAYKNQYLVVDAHYITTLGLVPEDRDWQEIGYDWARPKDMEARKRLYAKLAGTIMNANSNIKVKETA